MMSVLDIIHSLYAIIGVTGNLTLITIIIKTRSSGLNSYAVIIFNIACVDIIQITLDAFEVPRLIPYEDETVLVFHGYCPVFGPEWCYRCHLVMLHLIFHSLFLIAYSFWYRYTVLVREAPFWFAVQTGALLLFIPNALPMVFSLFATDNRNRSRAILHELYPTMDVNATTFRSVNLMDPYSAPTDFSAMVGPFVVYIFIVVMRRKVIQCRNTLKNRFGLRTVDRSNQTSQALTYQAILPSTICVGVCSFYFQLIGFHIPLIDGMMFICSCIPAIFNPLLTLYFVAPYRRF
ncbi:hypothetical protein PENTCL1PPCAC_16437, partial [Pristionchus entomophagus]